MESEMERIVKILRYGECHIDSDYQAQKVADFILADRRRMWEDPESILLDAIRFYNNCGKNIYPVKMLNEFNARMNEALSKIQELKGEV